MIARRKSERRKSWSLLLLLSIAFLFFLCSVVDEFDETTTFIYDNLLDRERECESVLKPRNGRAE